MAFQSALEGATRSIMGGAMAGSIKNKEPMLTQNQADALVRQSEEKYQMAMQRMQSQNEAYQKRIAEQSRFLSSKQKMRIEKNLGGPTDGKE